MITRREFGSLLAGAAGAAAVAPAWASPEPPATGGKRGCCFVTRDSRWRDRVEQLDPSWMYTWGSKRPEGLSERIDFTPMIWGAASDERFARFLERMKTEVAAGTVRHLMGFNEPDQSKQSNMTVERAVEMWPGLMELGVPLVSPGCVHPDREWMRDFMEEVEKRGLRVDAIAVHSYGGPSADHLLRRLESVSQEYGRPLWITEFAVGDWTAKSPEEHKHPPRRVARFMREVLPALNAADFVARYAWFSASPNSKALGTSALFDEQGALSPLGEIYANA